MRLPSATFSHLYWILKAKTRTKISFDQNIVDWYSLNRVSCFSTRIKPSPLPGGASCAPSNPLPPVLLGASHHPAPAGTVQRQSTKHIEKASTRRTHFSLRPSEEKRGVDGKILAVFPTICSTRARVEQLPNFIFLINIIRVSLFAVNSRPRSRFLLDCRMRSSSSHRHCVFRI